VTYRILQRPAGIRRVVQLAWLVWLSLPAQGTLGEEGVPDAAPAHRTRARRAPDADSGKRTDPAGTVPARGVEFAAKPKAATPAESGSTAVDEADPVRAAAATGADRSSRRQARRRQRTTVDPRLADLAATRGKVADVAHLHGVTPIEPAGSLAAAAEHRIRFQPPAKPNEPARPAAVPPAPAMTALDESIVKEIGQRKVLFRMCYESARRRGVLATRADVKWVLAADGSVHDVEVTVDQDAQLANCIRAVASRPFAGRVGQDLPVAIPLLFVSTR